MLLGMAFTLQGSLLDLAEETSLGEVSAGLTRRALTAGAWVDVRPGWLAGADPLLETLLHEVPWRAERRRMYDNVVTVPRLLAFYGEGEALPHPLLVQA